MLALQRLLKSACALPDADSQSQYLEAAEAETVVGEGYLAMAKDQRRRRRRGQLQVKHTSRYFWGLQLAFGLYLATISLVWSYHLAEKRMTVGQQTPLYGIWNVENFVQDGTIRTPLTTDRIRWQRIVIEAPKVLVIQMMDGEFRSAQYVH